MKFNCPKCSKPLRLSSELAGQVVKVRCSACGTVLKVKVKGGPDQAPAPSAPAPKPGPAAEVPKGNQWFAVVGKKRVGPFGQAALELLLQKGKIRGGTMLWREGMANWIQAGQIPEIRQLLDRIVPQQQPGVAEPPRPPAQARPSSAAERTVDPEFTADETGMDVDASTPVRAARPADTRMAAEESDHSFDWGGDEPVEHHDDSAAEDFFSVADHGDGFKGMEEIELGVPDVDPISIQQEGAQRGAKETLRDFSVMARLSGRSRRRNIVLLIVLGLLFGGALSAVFIFGNAFDFTGKQQDLVWENSEDGPNSFVKEKKKAEVVNQPLKQAVAQRPRTEDKEEPELDFNLMNEEALAQLQNVENGGIDKEALKEGFAKGSKDDEDAGSDKPRKHRKPVDDPTVWKTSGKQGAAGSETDLSGLLGDQKKTGLGVNLDQADEGSKIVDRAELGSSGFLGGSSSIEEKKISASVQERKSDGKLWKVRVRNNVIRKVNAERRRLQMCAENAGVDSGVRVILQVDAEAKVKKISAEEGGPQFISCLEAVLGNWKVDRSIPNAINLPIRLRFE